MSDEIDKAEELSSVILDAQLRNIRSHAQLDPGVAGECEKCGNESLRLIGGHCAPCRDKFKLP